MATLLFLIRVWQTHRVNESLSVVNGVGVRVTSVCVLRAEGSSNTRLHSWAAPRARHRRAHNVAIALRVQVRAQHTAVDRDIGRR